MCDACQDSSGECNAHTAVRHETWSGIARRSLPMPPAGSSLPIRLPDADDEIAQIGTGESETDYVGEWQRGLALGGAIWSILFDHCPSPTCHPQIVARIHHKTIAVFERSDQRLVLWKTPIAKVVPSHTFVSFRMEQRAAMGAEIHAIGHVLPQHGDLSINGKVEELAGPGSLIDEDGVRIGRSAE